MAEPLSIAASIAGLAHLAGTTYLGVSKYIKSAKDSRQKTAALAIEVRNVSGILQNLSLLAESLSESTVPASLRASYIDACQVTIKKINKLVDKAQSDFESGRKRDTIIRSVLSPFSDDQIDELLKDMARHKDALSLALNADTLEKLLGMERGQSKMGDDLRELREVVVDRFRIERRVQMDAHMQKVVAFFLKVNPQTSLDTSLRLRQHSTGLWLTKHDEDFLRWRSTSNSRLWLNGIPGAGKTVLCGAVIQEVLNQSSESSALAFFFCDYKNEKSHLPANILSALAVQLALQKESCFGILDAYYQTLQPHRGSHLPKEPELHKLADVLGSMVALYGEVSVMIDGLDECGAHVGEAVRSIKNLAEQNPNLSIALFSRDEDEIRAELGTIVEIKIAAHAHDLELYIAAEMAKRSELAEIGPDTRRIIHQALLDKAKGMFRWVACQIDFLCTEVDDEDRLAAIHKFPETLNETYDRILDRALDRNRSVNSREIIRRALLWICFQQDSPMPIAALCEALSVRENRKALKEGSRIPEGVISRAYSSLIRKSSDGETFELAHFTVLEYLTSLSPDSRLAMFRYDVEEACRTVAENCLRFLTLPKFNKTPPTPDENGMEAVRRRTEEHPFYPYAAAVWTQDSMTHLNHPQVFELGKTLFHPSKKPCFLNWLIHCLPEYAPRASLHYDSFYQGSEYLRAWSHFRTADYVAPTLPPSGTLYPATEVLQPQKKLLLLEQFRQSLLVILRPDFSTLHVSASIVWPQICHWLCSACGANPNLNGMIGSPISCALVGPGHLAIAQVSTTKLDIGSLPPKSTLRIRQTLESLLTAGAGQSNDSAFGSLGKLALNLCLDLESPAPLEPFISSGKCLDPDLVSRIHSLPNQIQRSPFMRRIYLNILEQAQTHSDVPQFSDLVSLAHTNLLAPSPATSNDEDSDDESDDREHRDDAEVREARDVQESLMVTNLATTGLKDGDFLAALENAVRFGRVRKLQQIMADPRYPGSGDVRFGKAKRTLVHVAAEGNSEEALRALLESGCDASTLDKRGMAPQHLCFGHQESALRVLLESGQRTCMTTTSGLTVYHLAARYGHLGMLKFLVGADNEKLEALRVVSNAGRTPLAEALNANRQDCVLFLCGVCPSEPEYYQSRDTSVYVLATRTGSAQIVDAVLQKRLPLAPPPNLLHHLNHRATLTLVRNLKREFDLGEKQGGRTALESLLRNARGALSDDDSGSVSDSDEGDDASDDTKSTGASTDDEDSPGLEAAVIEELLLPEHANPVPSEVHIWDFFSNMMHEDSSWWQYKIPKLIIPVIRTLWRGGVLANYTRHSGQRPSDALFRATSAPGLSNFWIRPLIKEMNSNKCKAGRVTTNNSHAIDLLKRSIDFLTPFPSERTLLRELLTFGVSIYARDPNGSGSAIEHACTAGSMASFETLLSAADAKDPYKPEGIETDIIFKLVGRTRQRRHDRALQLAKLDFVLSRSDFDANSRKILGSSSVPAIVFAANDGQFDAVDILLKHGADIFAASSNGLDVLHAAVGTGHMGTLKLFEAESSYDWTGKARMMTKRSGRSGYLLCHECNLLHRAAYFGQVEALEFILQRGYLEDLESTTANGLTPLHLAILGDSIEMAEFLVKRGVNLNRMNHDGELPIDLALKRANSELVRTLLSHGAKNTTHPKWADIGVRAMASLLRNRADGSLGAQVQISALPRSFDMACRILEEAILDGDYTLFTQTMRIHKIGIDQPVGRCHACPPIVFAAVAMKLDILDWLLDAGASLQRAHCPQHQIADQAVVTVVAARLGSMSSEDLPPRGPGQLLQRVLDRALEQGVSWVEDPINGVHAAVLTGRVDTLDLLIAHVQRNASALRSSIRLRSDEEAVSCQTEEGIVRYLLSRPMMAKGNSNSLDNYCPWPVLKEPVITASDPTAIHLAAYLQNPEVTLALLQQGVDPNLADALGLTPLMCTESVQVAAHLLRHGASLASRASAMSYTPLMCAVSRGCLDLARFLVSRGASVNTRPDPSSRADISVLDCLFTSQGTRCPALFPYLVQQGADPHRPTEKGDTPAHQALCHTLTHPCLLSYVLNSDVWCGMSETRNGLLVDMLGWSQNQGHHSRDDKSRLSRRMRLLCRRMPPGGKRQSMLDFRRPGCRSALCTAARLGNLPALHLLLESGAELEMEGSPEGTALMTACLYGQVEVVKELVGRGAREDYGYCYNYHEGGSDSEHGGEGHRRSAVQIAAAAGFPAVVRWLLLGRHSERRLLCDTAANPDVECRHWSGLGKHRFPVPRHHLSRWGETPFETFVRLGMYRRSLFGSVIRTELGSGSNPPGKA